MDLNDEKNKDGLLEQVKRLMGDKYISSCSKTFYVYIFGDTSGNRSVYENLASALTPLSTFRFLSPPNELNAVMARQGFSRFLSSSLDVYCSSLSLVTLIEVAQAASQPCPPQCLQSHFIPASKYQTPTYGVSFSSERIDLFLPTKVLDPTCHVNPQD